MGVVKSVEKKKSVAGQFAVEYKSETYGDTFYEVLQSYCVTGRKSESPRERALSPYSLVEHSRTCESTL